MCQALCFPRAPGERSCSVRHLPSPSAPSFIQQLHPERDMVNDSTCGVGGDAPLLVPAYAALAGGTAGEHRGNLGSFRKLGADIRSDVFQYF